VKKQSKILERISIVENMFSPGLGLFVAKILKNSNQPSVETVVVDSDDVVSNMQSFRPDVVILDVDSLRYLNSLTIAMTVRGVVSDQVIIFMSDRANPVLVTEGMVAALWTRAYWIYQPSRNPATVFPEIVRAFNGTQQFDLSVLESAISNTTHFGLLSPQQHRVMRLLAMGGSNASIARECNLSIKAVERTIATASKLLEVEPTSVDTNHRVKAAIRYLKLMLFSDSVQPFLE